MSKFKSAGMKIAVLFAEAVGLDPNDVLSVHLSLPSGDLATLQFKVICTDEAGKAIIEDDDLKVELRTWKEETTDVSN